MNGSTLLNIIDRKIGDVNGDRIPDRVYLTGHKPFEPDSSFYDNIAVVIQDGRTGQEYRIALEANAGYNPRLFLGDFSGDQVDDIFVGIASGGSGGFGYYYVYSFLNNQSRKLFDYREFSQQYEYRVFYRDNYKVDVANLTLNKLYVIDISHHDPEYLREIYDANGKLLMPIHGDVSWVSVVYPIDFNEDGVFDLLAVQRVVGRYNADTLGYVETFLKWDDHEFATQMQWVGILGWPLAVPYQAI